MELPSPPPDIDFNETRVPLILGSNISTFILAVVAVCLRFLSRKLTRSMIWWDDVLITLSLAVAAPMFFSNVAWDVRHGFGRHIWAVTPSDALEVWAKALFIAELCYISGTACVKFSLLFFYWRIFKHSTIRKPIYAIGSIVTCWALALLLAIVFQCVPLSLVWDQYSTPSVGMADLSSDCKVNLRTLFVANAPPNIIIDVAIIVLPLPYVWKLHLRRTQKAALTYVFILGVCVVGVSIARLVYIFRFDFGNPDITWNFVATQTWTAVELNVSIACACLPSLQPLLNLILVGSVHRTTMASSVRRSELPIWPSRPKRNESHPSENTMIDQDHLVWERYFSEDAPFPRTLISSASRVQSCNLDKNPNENPVHEEHVHVRTDIQVVTHSMEGELS